jgi:hypothetical protein
MQFGVLALTFGVLCNRQASAGSITSVSASGPGGTVTDLVIDSSPFGTDDSVGFKANYTALAPIDFTMNISGSGSYYLGIAAGDIINSTSSAFPNFYANLLSGPAGTVTNGAGWETSVFSNGVTFSPPLSPTSVTFLGPPGIPVGGDTLIYVAFQTTAASAGTVAISLSPSPVPEPSTFALGLIGAIGCLGYCARRFRCQRCGSNRVVATR